MVVRRRTIKVANVEGCLFGVVIFTTFFTDAHFTAL